jgi:hypothetical protein
MGQKGQVLEASESCVCVCGESFCCLQQLEGRVGMGRLLVARIVKLCFGADGVCPSECCLLILWWGSFATPAGTPDFRGNSSSCTDSPPVF